MAKTKRRSCNTTRRKGKGREKAIRKTRRSGGIKGAGIRSTLEQWFEGFRNRFTRNNQDAIQHPNIIVFDKDFMQYVKEFIGCYKKEYFFKRPFKRGKCKTLSNDFPNIFLLMEKLHTYLMDSIKEEIKKKLNFINRKWNKLTGVQRDTDYQKLNKFIQNIETHQATIAKESTNDAISLFQVITGIEKSGQNNNIEEKHNNHIVEENRGGGSLLYSQEVVKQRWSLYSSMKLSRAAKNYLSADDKRDLVDFAQTQIINILEPYKYLPTKHLFRFNSEDALPSEEDQTNPLHESGHTEELKKPLNPPDTPDVSGISSTDKKISPLVTTPLSQFPSNVTASPPRTTRPSLFESTKLWQPTLQYPSPQTNTSHNSGTFKYNPLNLEDMLRVQGDNKSDTLDSRQLVWDAEDLKVENVPLSSRLKKND
jgi:hypothetical protein